METHKDDDDLKLAKASAGLLSDLERDLPKILWKAKSHPGRKHGHTQVKVRDLNRVISYVSKSFLRTENSCLLMIQIEPFQGEPQLLDAKLKAVLPPIVDAYLDHVQQSAAKQRHEHVDFQTAICTLLYTLCKVRGYKIIVGFLNNEPRYLEPILDAVERTAVQSPAQEVQWQVPYVLLLWLSHLLLTPFDLHSISTSPGLKIGGDEDIVFSQQLPPLISRIMRIGLRYLHTPTKAQDAAAVMLVRLSTRPDVQKFRLADSLVNDRLPKLESAAAEMPNMYEMLGSLRFVAGLASSAELSHLIPSIYRTCEKTFDEDDSSTLSSNAVAKKVIVKIFRNIAILSLRSISTNGPLVSFLQTTGVLENGIDYLLRSLGDKDTPVRYAAAKAISLIVLELEPEMAHEVIQALLDSFKEDMPRSALAAEFTTANPLKWHGLTLALSHTLFKRSASPDQLPDILNALISALQFQQRTATGSTLGTNVRDAANFGIWSLARRYTTAELLPVKANVLHNSSLNGSDIPVVQLLATQLILSACLDPAGNIRRGSSAAFQELVGRHPDQIHEGIALVQIVDYQAVSLRNRAMVSVANNAAAFHHMYWENLLEGLFGWRGLGSSDVSSRESAATSIARLASSQSAIRSLEVLQKVRSMLFQCSLQEEERLHGLTLTAANILEHIASLGSGHHRSLDVDLLHLLPFFGHLDNALKDFHPRLLRSEFPASFARFTTAICKALLLLGHLDMSHASTLPFQIIDVLVDRLLARHEDWILCVIPDLVTALLQLKRALSLPLGCIGAQALCKKVAVDGAKSTLHSAGRAIALGALASSYETSGLKSAKATTVVSTLSDLMDAMNVDWRIVGARALQLVVRNASGMAGMDAGVAQLVVSAVHRGLNDYTIDERGDVGSLVRLQAIACAAAVVSNSFFRPYSELVQILERDMYHLSLEKLDRVRLQAVKCRAKHLDLAGLAITDVASVSSQEYFEVALQPLSTDSPEWMQQALLEGCISCAGASAESLLQISREALASYLQKLGLVDLERLLSIYAAIMKGLLVDTMNLHPSLELLAFLLDMQLPQRLVASPTFKWRNLLSIVQKSHHKSNDIPKILAAVHVYYHLAEIPSIRKEVLKKLISMLKTNPYPRVRMTVAEVLYMVTREEDMKNCDWARPSSQHGNIIAELNNKYA